MLISVHVPRFWIVVEEARSPSLKGRPVIISSNFLEKTATHSQVLMASTEAEAFGVRPGISLAHARQLCPEAVVVSPELQLYAGVWEEVLALLLGYTPLVESMGPGEALCDVTGCERLYGDPVFLARELVERIRQTCDLPCLAGVGTNRLVAELAARVKVGEPKKGRREPGSGSGRVAFVAPGGEASFLAPMSIDMLPDIDPQTLITFQVLGLKTIGHLAMISEKALTSRMGIRGRQLARYARGIDDRPVCPIAQPVTVRVSRPCDGSDGFEPHPDPAIALDQLIHLLATDLSERLRKEQRAGRVLTLFVRIPRRIASRGGRYTEPARKVKPVDLVRTRDGDGEDGGQFFPNQDSRIHSMLPTPRQPGRTRPVAPTQKDTGERLRQEARALSREEPDPVFSIKALARTVTGRPVDDQRTLGELAWRLAERIRADTPASVLMSDPGAELLLEMREFAPVEQMVLPGLDGRPMDGRLNRIHRHESILASRFGASPFRHLAAVDHDTALEERKFRWGEGMA